MQVIVHHWPFTGFGRGDNVGHAAVEVRGGGDDCYISWWPNSLGRHYKVPGEQKLPGSVRSVTSFLYSVSANPQQTYEDDRAGEGGAHSKEIPVAGLDGRKIKVWWDDFQKTPPAWSALDVNCAMVSAFALRAGGADSILTGFAGWWRSWNAIWSPNDVARLAAEINKGHAALHR